MNNAEPKVISEKTKYKGNFAEIVEMKVKLDNGQIVEWEGVKTKNAVAVIALDDENNVRLGREYRPIHGKYIYQTASGVAEVSGSEEELKEQARKELREEFGVDSKNIEKLAMVIGAGRISMKWHIYLATNVFDSPLERDQNEIIEVIKKPINEALELLLSSNESHFAALLGILLAKQKLNL